MYPLALIVGAVVGIGVAAALIFAVGWLRLRRAEQEWDREEAEEPTWAP
jgi:hypothetical protein